MRSKNSDTMKNALTEGGASISGLLGGIGSWYTLCLSLCMSIVSFFALFGITLTILPLMFLQTYQLYFWLTAFVFTAASFYFYKKQKRHLTIDRDLLVINAGLLLFGLPFQQLTDYRDFFRFIGVSLILGGLFFFFFARKWKLVYRSVVEDGENTPIQSTKPVSFTASPVQTPVLANTSELGRSFTFILFVLIVFGFSINQYLMYRLNTKAAGMNLPNGEMNQVSPMKMTPFDIALAKERMDKNNDGICDTCGIPIQQCIDSGQIDCNMGNNPQAIGVLGTAHTHADLNIYIDGERLTLAKPENFMKSSFIHLDNNQNPSDANSVLHMHAKNVPLSVFFQSLGANLTKDSLTLSDGRVLKNGNGKTLKLYLDGKKVDELGDYSFQPLDKLLISYGPENDSNVVKQIDSVTNYAKDHQK